MAAFETAPDATERRNEIHERAHKRNVASGGDGVFSCAMSRLPRAARLGISLFVLILVVALLLFVVFPSGRSTAVAAATSKLTADSGTVRVLITQKWGNGELVLIRFDKKGDRMLRLVYATHGKRGWRAAGTTDQRADITDVAVGSLLVARSAGGKGQPPWSVAAGELGDPRIQGTQVRWSSGSTTTGARQDDSYLVVRQGTFNVVSVRYASKDGTEIATVPVG